MALLWEKVTNLRVAGKLFMGRNSSIVAENEDLSQSTLDMNQLVTLLKKRTVTAMTTSATISTAAILGGMISANQGAAGAATYTMPTGAVMAAALPADFVAGNYLDFTITNVSTNAAEDVTVAGASGMTANGNMFVPSNDATGSISFGTFRIVCTGAATYNFYRI